MHSRKHTGAWPWLWLALWCVVVLVCAEGPSHNRIFPNRQAKAAEILRESSWPQEQGKGYSVGNFALAGEVTPNGRIFGDIQLNPAHAEAELESVGEGSLSVNMPHLASPLHDYTLDGIEITRTFPEYMKLVRDSRLGDTWLSVRAHAPIDASDSLPGFLPALIVDVVLGRGGNQMADYASAEALHTSMDSRERTQTERQAEWKETSGHKSPQAQQARTQVQIAYEFAPAVLDSSHFAQHLPDGAAQQATEEAERAFNRAENGAQMVQQHNFFLVVTGGDAQTALALDGNLHARANVSLAEGETMRVSFVLGHYDSNGAYAEKIPSLVELVEHVVTKRQAHRQGHRSFVATLPRTGSPHVDTYLRWYTSAAVLLTKGQRGVPAYTMGHVSYQQRDSFWASWLHMHLWPELDRGMIRLAARSQLASGKIPHSLMPQTDRPGGIEGTEYFVLRVARHVLWYRDEELAQELWPAVDSALAYLQSLDAGDGIPQHRNEWADWKAAPFMRGRKYAANTALLYLATLKQGARVARLANRTRAAKRVDTRLEAASKFVNGDANQGQGLWNNTHYVDVWRDGRAVDYVQQDQLVGLLWDVVPAQRSTSMLDKLMQSENRCGVRETYPYNVAWPEPSNGYNGGVWPWLNFVDAGVRFRAGRPADALRLLHAMGERGLRSNDASHPAEFLDGDECRAHTHPVQAWNSDAAVYASVLHGLYALERVDTHTHTIPGTATAGKRVYTLRVMTELLQRNDHAHARTQRLRRQEGNENEDTHAYQQQQQQQQQHFDTYLPLGGARVHLKVCHGTEDGHDEHDERFLEISVEPPQEDVILHIHFDRRPVCSRLCHLVASDTACRRCSSAQSRMAKRQPMRMTMSGRETQFVEV